ncbi:MAG: hypothetical protein FJ088_11920, partial [Deltaproteobacteria bacterium]|nr:hypothetical protein [Deltaproteobacteria bacterium]
IDGKWSYYLAVAYYLDGCNLSVTKGAVEETPSGFRIELTNRGGKVAVNSEEECRIELADTTPDEQLDCKFKEIYEAEIIKY